jgi:hypothetical protein
MPARSLVDELRGPACKPCDVAFRPDGAELAAGAEEVDDLYRVWSASNAKLMSAPESKSWGLHEFTAADLDGNLFRVFYDFATPERSKDA